MKTQCPSCKTISNVSDEHKGKKAKCKKCQQVFVINPIDEETTGNLCEKKENNIAKPQEEEIGQEPEATHKESEDSSEGLNPLERKILLGLDKILLKVAKVIGFVIAVFFILGGIGWMFNEPPTLKPYEVYIINDGVRGIIGGMEPKGTNATMEQLYRFNQIAFGGGYVSLGIFPLYLIFHSGLTISRTIAFFFGSLLVCFAFFPLVYGFILWGTQTEVGGIMGCMIFGGILVAFGLSKKRRNNN